VASASKPRGKAGGEMDPTCYFFSMAFKMGRNGHYFRMARFVYAVNRRKKRSGWPEVD